MRSFRFWLPVILSFAAVPFCLLLAMVSAGAGHGNYFVAKLIFPYTMLSTEIFGSITMPFVILAFAQMPFYGLFLGIANVKNKIASMAILLAAIHCLAVGACFLFIGKNFS